MSPIELTSLPDEVLQNVLFRLDYDNVLALEATCRRFQAVTNEPRLWKAFCQDHWKKWHPRHDFKARIARREFTAWKRLFAERTRSSRDVQALIDGIIENDQNRIPKIEKIVELGYDAKDVLIKGFQLAHLSENDELARRYWNQEVLGCLHRAMALKVWTTLHYDSTDEQAYELSLGALDLFVLTASRQGDIEDIFTMLDFYVTSIRQDCQGIDEWSPHEKAISVARYLKAREWTGICEGQQYQKIEHNFLGVALYSAAHNSLPVISVVIYCYVARELGLRAAPCNFPMHVYAVVRPPKGLDLDGGPLDEGAEDPAMYMDPFRSDREVPLSSLKAQLQIMSGAFTNTELDLFLLETNAREITLRCARNILNSQDNIENALEDIDLYGSAYGSAWAFLVVSDTDDRRHLEEPTVLMRTFFESSTNDVGLIEKYILPMCVELGEYDQYVRGCRSIRENDASRSGAKYRSGKSTRVKYKIGQVFRHKRYNYMAVIIGWDPECSSGELWIRQMGVDQLPNGRKQAFYHAFVKDESYRYVAEDNIEIISIEKEVADSFSLEAGKFFKRWDDEQKVFISNMQIEYPDD